MSLKTWIAGEKVNAADLNSNFDKIGGDYIPGTAGENITAGKPGYISTADQKIYHAHGYKANGNSSITLTDSLRIFRRLNATQFLHLRQNTNTITIDVFNKDTGANVANATVTTAAATSTETAPRCAVARIDDSKFIVFWAASTGNNALRYRTGSISGSTITMDTDSAYPTGTKDFAKHLDACNGNVDGVCVLGLEHSDSDTAGTHNYSLLYLTVATNSVTQTAIQTVAKASGSFNITARWIKVALTTTNVTYMAYCFSGSSDETKWEYHYHDITAASGAAGISWYPQIASAGYNDSGSAPMGARPSFVGGYDSVYTGELFTYAVTATERISIVNIHKFKYNSERTITINNRYNFRNTPGTARLKMWGNENGITIQANGVHLYMQLIHGEEVFRNMTITTGLTPDYQDAMYMASKDESVVLNGSSIYRSFLPTPCHGIIFTTATANNSSALKDGYVSGLSGLTDKRQYFLKDGYTNAGDLDIVGTVPVGRSLSTTLLLIYRGY